MAPSKDALPVQYTLVIRLPFPRGEFQDPPQVQWDTSKDKKLWKLIARNPKAAGVIGGGGSGNGEIDWPAIAADFGVDTPFLLQQAAWLYERHFKHVKAQMTRIRASSNTASPVPGQGPGPSSSALGKRPAGLGSRAPSALSIRSKSGDSPVPRDPSTPNTPLLAHAPSLSRTPSTTTVTQSTRHFLPPSPRPRSLRPAVSGIKRAEPGESALRTSTVLSSDAGSSSSSSDSTSSEDVDDSRGANTFRRPHRFGPRRPSTIHSTNEEDDEEYSEPAFSTYLPPAATEGKSQATAPKSKTDPSATLRTDTQDSTRNTSGSSSRHRDQQQQHSEADSSTRSPRDRVLAVDSSTGSMGSGTSGAAQNQATGRQQNQAHRRGLAALSPRQLARLNSPRRGGGAGGAETSDGTPSMGSSFSDLDDASITQSAMEEALASNIRQGAGSRLSNFSHAFRSSRG